MRCWERGGVGVDWEALMAQGHQKCANSDFCCFLLSDVFLFDDEICYCLLFGIRFALFLSLEIYFQFLLLFFQRREGRKERGKNRKITDLTEYPLVGPHRVLSGNVSGLYVCTLCERQQ